VKIEQSLDQLADLLTHRDIGRSLERRNQFLYSAKPFLEFLGAGFVHNFHYEIIALC
jgi:hypothetical protein